MADMWNERYGVDAWFYGTAPNEFLQEYEPRIARDGAVLCLAEGEGRNAVFLAERGHRVTAVDQSAVGLEKAARLARERGVEIETVCADLAHFVIEPAKYDAIVSIWCHLPSPLRRDVHRRVIAGLKPGGMLLLEAYTPRQLELGTGGPPDEDRMMTLAALREELEELEHEHALELERLVREGFGHNGRSAVVQLVARKPE